MIATGFGDGREGRASSGAQTPVDLQHYSSWYRVHQDAQPVADAASATPSIPVRRRSGISVPAQARAVVGGVPIDPPEQASAADEASPLDVPAFLRRNRDS